MNQDCVNWLKKELARGDDVSIDEIRGQARKRGFTKRELKDARHVLGVRLRTTADGYFWYM